MPQPLTNFDMNSLTSGYDPVAGMETSAGLTGDLSDDDNDEGLSVSSQETDDDSEGDTGADDAAAAAESASEADDEGGQEAGEGGESTDGGDTAAADTGGDDPEAGGESEADEELIPGVDPAFTREQLKEKTQERIRTLANQNKEKDRRLNDLQTKYDELRQKAERSGNGQTEAESMEQAAADIGLELDDDVINGMWDKAIDGDFKTATATFTDIIRKVAEQAVVQATTQSRAATTHEQQVSELNKAVERLTTDYSQLDPESPDFDESLALEVRDLRDFYITQKGMAPAEALEKAAERELTLRGMWGKESILNDAPTVDVAAETQRRNAEAAKQKLKVEQPAPPRSKGEAQGEQKRSIMDLTDEEFDALSNAELEKMTGTQYR